MLVCQNTPTAKFPGISRFFEPCKPRPDGDRKCNPQAAQPNKKREITADKHKKKTPETGVSKSKATVKIGAENDIQKQQIANFR